MAMTQMTMTKSETAITNKYKYSNNGMNSAGHCRLCNDKDDPYIFLIAVRHSVKVVKSSSLRVNHLIRLSFFSIKKFTFSLVPTYFVWV